MGKYTLAILLIILFLCGMIVGWAVNDIENQRKYDGLWFAGNLTHSEALSLARSYDTYGDWICVNIKGMSVQRMIEVCQHESAHEIFAEKCQDNATRCLEAVK